MLGQIQKLEQVVKDMYKPKQEVKEVATRLALHAEKLKTKELANWLEQIVKNNGTEEGEKEWRKENEWLKQQMLDMEESQKRNRKLNQATFGTQCQECEKETIKKKDGKFSHRNRILKISRA
ncbi:hypothetical protein JTB14_001580 [Gonioctena quinquepunctata]|nr:hypothetical protein JTB14_001580 [Gonioctena quinquepunctata]